MAKKIPGTAPHGLRILNQFDGDLRQERTLDIAGVPDLYDGMGLKRKGLTPRGGASGPLVHARP